MSFVQVDVYCGEKYDHTAAHYVPAEKGESLADLYNECNQLTARRAVVVPIEDEAAE